MLKFETSLLVTARVPRGRNNNTVPTPGPSTDTISFMTKIVTKSNFSQVRTHASDKYQQIELHIGILYSSYTFSPQLRIHASDEYPQIKLSL